MFHSRQDCDDGDDDDGDDDGASDVDDVVVQASGGPDGAAAELRAHLGLAWAVGFHLFNRFSSF